MDRLLSMRVFGRVVDLGSFAAAARDLWTPGWRRPGPAPAEPVGDLEAPLIRSVSS